MFLATLVCISQRAFNFRERQFQFRFYLRSLLAILFAFGYSGGGVGADFGSAFSGGEEQSVSDVLPSACGPWSVLVDMSVLALLSRVQGQYC